MAPSCMPRILIADDSPTIRKMVRASLQTLDDTEFLEAASGLEAIGQLAIAAVQLVVLDLNMPDMHGIETCCGSCADSSATALSS